MSCFLGTRSRMTATGASGSSRRSTRTALRSAAAAPDSALNTTPGESSRRICLSRTTSCTPRVTPGALPTCATRARLRLLMSDDLPTFGRPTTPTVIEALPPARERA